MSNDKRPTQSSRDTHDDTHDDQNKTSGMFGVSRRDFIGSTAAGAAAGVFSTLGLDTALAANPGSPPGPPPNNANKQILLKGGIVLTMDPDGMDYNKADVLVQGSKIKAIGPNVGGSGEVIDCTGKIVCPGFINTHHHQYETIARAAIPDGLLRGNWPQESYGSVVQNVWTSGRIVDSGNVLWDLGRSPYDPEDCYISEVVAGVAGINAGVTTGIDTSQSSHTAEHSDAMIEGLMASGRRSIYTYAGGRSPNQPGYEYPGSTGNTTSGIGRIATKYFNSNDQLVTLGFSGSADLWRLAREFGAVIVNHDFTGAALVAQKDTPAPDNVGDDMQSIHCVDFTPEAWQVAADKGVKISIAHAIEMQMWHGTPPIQSALDYHILPSLSSDVDTNMTESMFSLMRSAFTLQHMFVKNSAPLTVTYPDIGKPTISCHQILEIATRGGAALPSLRNKVGMLREGMEADIIVLNARAINTHPMVNAPGTVVTMMDTSNVETVLIGGQIKKRDGKLVGVNVEKLLTDVEKSQERVLARIHGPAQVGTLPDFTHEGPGYTPSLTGSCCQAVDAYNATP
jgi:5-methylthioadenosine/S-adenosylhomocysteine deaminase